MKWNIFFLLLFSAWITNNWIHSEFKEAILINEVKKMHNIKSEIQYITKWFSNIHSSWLFSFLSIYLFHFWISSHNFPIRIRINQYCHTTQYVKVMKFLFLNCTILFMLEKCDYYYPPPPLKKGCNGSFHKMLCVKT